MLIKRQNETKIVKQNVVIMLYELYICHVRTLEIKFIASDSGLQ